MSKVELYNRELKKIGEIKSFSEEETFKLPWNDILLHQVIVSYNANERQGLAHTKQRSEVRGGGKKPWRQKGTGRARHGSSRSPIWKGGGVTFGPRNEKSYSQKINKKQKTKATFMVISQKIRDKAVLFIDNLNLTKPNTSSAQKIVDNVRKKLDIHSSNIVVILKQNDENIRKSFSNIPKTITTTIDTVNPKILLNSGVLLFVGDESILENLIQKNI